MPHASHLTPHTFLRVLCASFAITLFKIVIISIYIFDIQSHEFPLLFKEGWPGMLISGYFMQLIDRLFKEGWPGMLISGYFMQLIDRPGWLIVATEESSGDESSFPMPL
jgi:hypothetical protein